MMDQSTCVMKNAGIVPDDFKSDRDVPLYKNMTKQKLGQIVLDKLQSSQANVKKMVHIIGDWKDKQSNPDGSDIDNPPAVGTQNVQLGDETVVVNKESITEIKGLLNDTQDVIDKLIIDVKQTSKCCYDISGNSVAANENDRHVETSEKLQIFFPHKTELTTSFEKDITRLIKGMSIKFNTYYDAIRVIENLPLLVVCSIVSRIETDIDSALEKIKFSLDRRPFAFLILHTCVESSLPQMKTSTILGNKKYSSMVIIDIAYTMDKGIYECDMNTDAKQQLKTFFQDQGIQKQSSCAIQ